MTDKIFLDTNIFIYSIVTAIRVHRKYMLSFWDALIVQAANMAGCVQLLSEDLQDGFQIDNLTINNPFVS